LARVKKSIVTLSQAVVVRTEPGIDEEVAPGSTVSIYLARTGIIQTVVPIL
jgi:hypothetical protein